MIGQLTWWVRSPNWSAGSRLWLLTFDMRAGCQISLGSPRMYLQILVTIIVLGFGPGTGGTKCGHPMWIMVNDTWYHIAVVKYNNVTKMYTNGVTGASGTYPTVSYADTTDYKTD